MPLLRSTDEARCRQNSPRADELLVSCYLQGTWYNVATLSGGRVLTRLDGVDWNGTTFITDHSSHSEGFSVFDYMLFLADAIWACLNAARTV